MELESYLSALRKKYQLSEVEIDYFRIHAKKYPVAVKNTILDLLSDDYDTFPFLAQIGRLIEARKEDQ